jgi:hypothetical protein
MSLYVDKIMMFKQIKNWIAFFLSFLLKQFEQITQLLQNSCQDKKPRVNWLFLDFW